ncbi:DUF1684 domain-containing protein [Tundrisphaera lichenicola]|uniref:DUF1684 domain-containing protein n=1 Tax=Tundrisphaera lichenicola TaxID=2029860 RepID=UPI003EC13715
MTRWIPRRSFLVPIFMALAAAGPASADEDYRAEVERFRLDREAGLKAEDGWLTVAGLAWVRPGESKVGGDPSSDVLLPEGAPPTVGVLTLDGQKAAFRPAPGVTFLRGGRPFEGGEIHSDAKGLPDVLAVGRFRLILLKRGDRFAIRIKDNESPIRRDFAGLRWFPVAEDWKIAAKFTPHPVPTEIAFDTIVGTRDVLPSPGYATFERDGQTYRLDAASEPDGRLWFVFRDATAGRTTPANARQLTAEPPLGDSVILDFNKAVNLPCAYTPHATCPIAPPRNRLGLEVDAGEKSYQTRGDRD